MIVGAVIREATRRILLLEERIERELAEPDAKETPAPAAPSSPPPTTTPPPRPSGGLGGLLEILRGGA